MNWAKLNWAKFVRELAGFRYYSKFHLGILLCCSALLHFLADLPLHHDDPHRHFLPLTNWRFESPISYWDPSHYGNIVMWAECIFVFAACVYVSWKSNHQAPRIAAISTLVVYVSSIGFAFLFWI